VNKLDRMDEIAAGFDIGPATAWIKDNWLT
jgi:hypothetical protein